MGTSEKALEKGGEFAVAVSSMRKMTSCQAVTGHGERMKLVDSR